ncbi:MAG: class I SAM-dependent methyltransferase [Rhodospirillales bacterium]|nr:MAG: class I SAM-dependent methyltransferase [Rhodospirillales bacterium]
MSGTYGNPAVDIVELVGELFGNLDLPTLKGESAVFEGGCNIGRNLLALQKAYGCFVEGADISEQAIAIARNEVFGGSARSRFTSANLLDPDFFHSYSDNQFDLVITRAHLMHIPKSPAKLHYIEELKRIGKMFLMIEPEIQGRSGTEFHQHGAYALSWDDWENDYHMVRYQPNTKIPASYSVFYNKKTLPSLGS